MRKILAVIAVCVLATCAWAVQAGDPAPEFKAASTAGREVMLQDFAGQWLVLYFYPKSFTPGCTREACSLRDGFAEIQQAGGVILGASVDSLETQQKFKAEHKLPFDLLADRDGAVARAYDVLGLGGFMAKRVTFIIGPDGRIARVIDDVQTGGHDAQVAAALRELQAPKP